MAINKVILVGNLGKDPEIRAMQSGARVCNFSIATTERWKDKETGDKREHTDWHNIVVWPEGLIDVCEKYLKKGHKVYVEGALKTRKWQDQSGQDRWATEVVLRGFDAKLELCGAPTGGGNRPPAAQSEMDYGRPGPEPSGNSGGMRPASASKNEFDDEIPF